MEDEPVISYSLKEILGQINVKLDMSLGLIHGKADSSRVDDVDARLRTVEAHIEHTAKNKSARDHYREWLIPILLTAVMTLVAVLQLVHF